VTIADHTTDRRRVLGLVGAAGAAAFLAACGKDSNGGATGATTTTLAPDANDVALLTTAASLEELEVAIYKAGLDGGAFKTPAVVEAVKAMSAQHRSHAALFEGHTSRLGGATPIAPNAALNAQLQPRLANADEAALLHVLFDVAQITTATYQDSLGRVADHRLNTVFMSVCGAEARHAALIGSFINQTLPAGSFGTTEKAVH
jgi:hypothetical protein